MSEDSSIKAYLAENPRMIGVLFAMLLLLSQAGNVAAANAGISGP
jgi:hypothetical protein